MDSVSAKPNMPFVRSYKTVSLSQLGNPQPVQTPEQPKEVVPKRTRQAYIPVAALPQAQTPAQSQPPQPAITPLSKNKRIASFNKPSLPPVQPFRFRSAIAGQRNRIIGCQKDTAIFKGCYLSPIRFHNVL